MGRVVSVTGREVIIPAGGQWGSITSLLHVLGLACYVLSLLRHLAVTTLSGLTSTKIRTEIFLSQLKTGAPDATDPVRYIV